MLVGRNCGNDLLLWIRTCVGIYKKGGAEPERLLDMSMAVSSHFVSSGTNYKLLGKVGRIVIRVLGLWEGMHRK